MVCSICRYKLYRIQIRMQMRSNFAGCSNEKETFVLKYAHIVQKFNGIPSQRKLVDSFSILIKKNYN